ncbi:uncharacterized protein cep126 isoform X2 [Esox lucius]|uniref:uncharacterized protein cep126 isoform X2 n=1 Tax=Esox lucius TaxID=8010 RepID=UPI001476BB14|nr:uncharacterized protein cep126 isoform X2 [Esox lucius]
MQALKDNIFYSKDQIRVGGAFEDERQLLVQEQKTCRTQARLFSLETNRRRKVLEERRKQWDVQEQMLRENILQQRKQRVQDATERFQRAHLPLSQRHRQTFRNSPDIEEALNNIKENVTLSSFARQSVILSSNSTISRSCTPSPKPPLTASPSLHHRTMSVLEAFTKLGQDRPLSTFKNSQQLFLNELQGTHLEDRDTCTSPQDQRENHLTDSESLSSLDSLENQDVTHDNTNNNKSLCQFSLDHLDNERPGHQPIPQNHPSPWSDQSLYPTGRRFLSDNLPPPQGPADVSPQPTRETQTGELFGDLSRRLHHDCGATGGQSFTNKLSLHTDAVTQPPLLSGVAEHRLLPGAIGRASVEPSHADPHTQKSDPRDSVSVVVAGSKASNPDNLRLQFTPCVTPEAKLGLGQRVKNQDLTSHFTHLTSTRVFLSGKNCSHKDLLCETTISSPGPVCTNCGAEVKEDTIVSLESTQHPSHRRKPHVDTREDLTREDLTKTSVSKAGRGTSNTNTLGQTTCRSNIRSDFPKGLQQEVMPSQALDTAIPTPSLPYRNNTDPSDGAEVKLIKGILKKPPKCRVSGGEARSSLYRAGHLMFTKQVAISIRDSVELTRTKVRNAEDNSKVKKKIRWLDEAKLEEEEEEKEIQPDHHLKNKPSFPQHNQQQSLGLARAHTSTPGYHFTKQAWADVRVQERRQEAWETRVEVRGQRGRGGRPGFPRVPRRVGSARAGTGPSLSRKGRVIRTQSASEASRDVVMVTQGKVKAPRPPPRADPQEHRAQPGEAAAVVSYSTKSPHGVLDPTNASVSFITVHSSGAPAGVSVERAFCNRDTLDGFHLSHAQVLKAGGGVIFMPLPPPYASSCTISSPSTTTPGSVQRDALGGPARRGILYDKGLCLGHTPTDEEISQLWHGVRRALTTKEDDQRNSPYDNLCALPQAHANLSHTTTSGHRHSCGVKAVTGTEGFFVSSYNGRGLVRKPTQENCGPRRRGAPGSGNRRLPLPSQSQALGLMTALQTKNDLTYQDSEYAAEADSEMAVAVETIQTPRPPLGLPQQRSHAQGQWCPQQGQNQGLTTISLEEQKVLLSLDRLNHQLQYVQEYTGGNAAGKAVLQGSSPFAGGVSAAGPRRPPNVSAYNRSRTQRRF